MSETKEVFVKVIGTQYLAGGDEGGEEEPIELLTVGYLTEEDGAVTVVYEEVFEGMEEFPTTNTVRIEKDFFSVEKHGAADVTMVFEPGKMSVSPYETPHGEDGGEDTHSLGVHAGDERGERGGLCA